MVLTFPRASELFIFVVQVLPGIWPSKKNSSFILTEVKDRALAANRDLNLQDMLHVAALRFLFLSSKFPRQTLPLNAPVRESFFQNCHLASETDSRHDSAQQQQCDMAETVSSLLPTVPASQPHKIPSS